MKTSFAVILLLAVVAGSEAASVYKTAKKAGLTTLVAAIDAAGFKALLDDPKFKGTVFAPTNPAFAKLLKALGLTAEEILGNKALLQAVLKYHVITPARFPSKKIPKHIVKVKTLLGQNLRVKKAQSGKTVFLYYPQKKWDTRAKVLVADVKANKAIVHVINKVLVPAL